MVHQSHPDELIAEVLNATNPVDIDGLLARVIAEFGGVEGLAKKLGILYDELPKNSASRERILSNIMKLISLRTVSATANLPTDQAELEAVLRHELQQGT